MLVSSVGKTVPGSKVPTTVKAQPRPKPRVPLPASRFNSAIKTWQENLPPLPALTLPTLPAWPQLGWPGLALPKVPRPSGQIAQPTYADFLLMLRNTAANPRPASRLQFLEFFNHRVSVSLHTEECLAQALAMHVSYLRLQVGNPIDVHVRRNIRGNPVHDYARHYHVSDMIIDSTFGLVAYLLEPGLIDTYVNKRAIIIFRGTSPRERRDVLAPHYPAGLRADIDVAGIGKTAVLGNRRKLMEWVQAAFNRGQGVTLLGHSLGGAQCAHLLSCMSPAQQSRCRVITCNAPGIDARAAAAIWDFNNVTLVRNFFDKITLAGELHPRAEVLEYYDPEYPHGFAGLMQQELDGNQLLFKHRRAQPRDTAPELEIARKLLGYLAANRTEI